nr:MAG TPA: hypothetical protein [Caudoviricetes sp.]
MPIFESQIWCIFLAVLLAIAARKSDVCTTKRRYIP